MRKRTHDISWQIGSRVVVIVLLTLPLAAAALQFDRQERQMIDSLDYDALVTYLKSNLMANYWACFGLLLVVGFGYVAAVEGISFVARIAASRIRKEDSHNNSQEPMR
jgi:hypothetical protein